MFFVPVVFCYDCLFQGVISILKMFQELSVSGFKLDKQVFLEKVYVLYKRLYFASFSLSLVIDLSQSSLEFCT